MPLLTQSPLAPLLDRLFAEAEMASPSVRAIFSETNGEETDRMMRSKTAYLDLYGKLKDIALPVSRETGTLLHMLARSSRAQSVVEFGTSTLYLAAALRENGGGLLITSEFEPSKLARARANLTEAGLADLVEFREGDALETLASDLPDTIDLLLLDGAKSLYPEVLDLVEPHLRHGAFVVADNADYCPDYLDHVRNPANGYLSQPFNVDVELSLYVP
ncbi:O-methyltransferase [Nisaea sediminum]|uniref:O-methyltransferase n=1 Tax=Nisaea sediminum TaxID=2775867 RepID=UPI0018669F31|nr:class I SAM-dependent methyltransferase [Nisaea sediminum]